MYFNVEQAIISCATSFLKNLDSDTTHAKLPVARLTCTCTAFQCIVHKDVQRKAKLLSLGKNYLYYPYLVGNAGDKRFDV